MLYEGGGAIGDLMGVVFIFFLFFFFFFSSTCPSGMNTSPPRSISYTHVPFFPTSGSGEGSMGADVPPLLVDRKARLDASLFLRLELRTERGLGGVERLGQGWTEGRTGEGAGGYLMGRSIGLLDCGDERDESQRGLR